MAYEDVYSIIGSYLGISAAATIILLTIVSIWSIIWKGLALWKSGRKTRTVWFIALLIANTIGLFEIAYLFIFSKIKDKKSFRKVHDVLLIISIIFAGLTVWSFSRAGILTSFLWIPMFFFLGLFSISLIQESVDRRESIWIVLGILLMPLVPIIYYFAKVRESKGKPAKPEKKKKK